MKTFYTIYKVTNQINGKFYIGSHKTKDLGDGYIGSGKYLKYSQGKHGIENFKKEILFVFDTPEEMYAKEAEIVNEDFLATENTYNLKIGGYGGWDFNNQNIDSNEMARRGKIGQEKQREWLIETHGVDHVSKLPEVKEKISKRMSNVYPKGTTWCSFAGKQHSDEVKRKIGEKNSKHQTGSGNSQFGTMWITNGVENKKVKKDSIIPVGYSKGRKIC